MGLSRTVSEINGVHTGLCTRPTAGRFATSQRGRADVPKRVCSAAVIQLRRDWPQLDRRATSVLLTFDAQNSRAAVESQSHHCCGAGTRQTSPLHWLLCCGITIIRSKSIWYSKRRRKRSL